MHCVYYIYVMTGYLDVYMFWTNFFFSKLNETHILSTLSTGFEHGYSFL